MSEQLLSVKLLQHQNLKNYLVMKGYRLVLKWLKNQNSLLPKTRAFGIISLLVALPLIPTKDRINLKEGRGEMVLSYVISS